MVFQDEMSGFQGQHPRVEQVYDLGKVLGKGSFSTVYQGTHKQTKEVVSAFFMLAARGHETNCDPSPHSAHDVSKADGRSLCMSVA